MSDTNVENLRAWAEAWQMNPAGGPLLDRGGGEVDLVFNFDPEVTYEDMDLPDHIGEAYHGREGVIRATERWVEPFDEMSVDLERIVGTGDCLVSIHRWRAIAFDEPLAIVWKFRDGKVIHFRSFRDPDEALEAAGLSE